MATPSRRSARFSMRSKQIGQILIENNDTTPEQVAKALKIQEAEGGLLGQILVRMGACQPALVAAALLKQAQVTDCPLDELTIPPEVAALVQRVTCESERLVPFERMGSILCVAMANPLKTESRTLVEERTGLKLKTFRAPWAQISAAIQRTYTPEVEDAAAKAPAPAPAREADLKAGPGAEGSKTGPKPAVADADFRLSFDAGAPAAPAGEKPAGPAPSVMQIPTPEILDVKPEAPVAAPQDAPQAAAPAAPATTLKSPEAKIEGLDDLDKEGELVAEDRRGLSRRGRRKLTPEEEEAGRPKVKEATVNVDLDSFKPESSDVVVPVETKADEVEIHPAGAGPALEAPPDEGAVAAAATQAMPAAAERPAEKAEPAVKAIPLPEGEELGEEDLASLPVPAIPTEPKGPAAPEELVGFQAMQLATFYADPIPVAEVVEAGTGDEEKISFGPPAELDSLIAEVPAAEVVADSRAAFDRVHQQAKAAHEKAKAEYEYILDRRERILRAKEVRRRELDVHRKAEEDAKRKEEEARRKEEEAKAEAERQAKEAEKRKAEDEARRSAAVVAATAAPAAKARTALSVEMMPAPPTPMRAVKLSDDDFKKLVADLDVDPIGEWDWQYVAAGPIPAVAVEE